MRIVLVGAGQEALKTARLLCKKNHEVIIIEKDEEKIKTFEDELDCGLIKGDGANPHILQETNPESVDFLMGLTNSDKDNMIIGLLGKSLKFRKVLVSIVDASYEKICQQLNIENVIIPSQTIAKSLVSFIETENSASPEECIKDKARLIKLFIKQKSSIHDLELPNGSKPICFYRDGNFNFFKEETHLKEDDELIILTTENGVKKFKNNE